MSDQTFTGQPEVLPPPNFRALFEAAPGLYLVLTPDLKIVAVSNAYLRATMTQREAILGRGIFEVFPDNPDDPHATGVRNLNASLRRVLRHRAPDGMPVQKYDIRRPADQGGGFEERYWSPVNTPVLGPNGEVAYIIHRVEDVTEQQRHQGELFRLMVENTPDYAIFVMDAEGRVQTWSPAAQALLGYREEEVVGQPADRFFTPDDRRLGAPAQEMQQSLTNGHAEGERWYVRSDGSRLWASATTTALRGPGQRVRGFATIMRDSTDRKRAEEARNEAQAYAESIVETVREPLLILDADLRVRRANRSFYSTFRVAPEDTEQRLLYDLGDGQWDIPALRRLLGEILPGNTAFNDYEVVHAFPSIGRKVMLLNARRLYREGNRTEFVLLAIEDITERRRAEDALAVQQEWQRVTLRSIGDAVITTDVNSRVTYLNPVAETLTGWTTAEASGLPLETVFQIVNEETRKKVENPVTKSLRDGHVVGLANHTMLISKGGGERSIDDSAAPIRAASGEVIGVVLTFRDISDRRRAERAAQAALEYAENVVETVRESLLVLDGDLRVQSANASFYRTFRVTPAETENCLLYDLGNRQWDIPALRKLLEEILPHQSSFNDFEVTHDFESIGRKVMLLNARRIRREQQSTGLILLAIEDITERRRIEEERRELETRFTSLVKNIRDHSIFTLDPQGRITSWNREAERILGYAEAEVLGQPFAIIFTPEDVAQGVPGLELRTALAQGRAEDERWHRRKNGERFWALGIVTPTQDATGGHTGFSKILRDMTERKRAEEQVRFQADVLDRVEQAVIVTDPDGRITYWNRFAERLYGWSREEATGRSVGELIVAPGEAGRAAEIMASLRAGRNWSGEFLVRRRDGTAFPALVSDTPMLDGDGRLRGIIGISADLTERKRLEEQLRLRVGELAEADRRKDEFLAMLAHELRNPLAPIRTGLDRMRLKVPPDSPLHPVMDTVERQLGQMTRLVDDLLDVSRITRGQITLQKERADLHAVIAQAVETARPVIDARQHDLTYTPAPEPLRLEADPTRLAQALSNVLSNAAKYTEKGGRIWLAAERGQGEAVVRVRDNGMGIAPEMLAKVFELFTQAHPAPYQSQGGLGVGLAVAKRLVEMHGGSVTAHSAGEGQGSEFVFRLPLLTESGGVETAVRGGMGVPGRTAGCRRILLVDDLADVAEDMAALVREAFGHEVRTAHDGPTALRVAAEFRPELVLLDIGLPGMSGYEVARRLRQQAGLGDVVLVALTGWGQEEDRRKTKEAGFDHHLVKPVGLKELQQLLADLK
jgi:PAS domain S-box-containing protein